MTKNMKRIHSVTIQRITDKDPDTSYLQQEGYEERWQQFQDGQFNFIGIMACAEVTKAFSATVTLAEYKGHGGIAQSITSGGLWGIESDSDRSYLQEIEDEQLSELREQLRAFGFSQRAISATFKNVVR